MMTDRVRNFLAPLLIAAGISLTIHFLLFIVVASAGNESSVLARAAEAILAPAGAIAEDLLPGHSLAQFVYIFVISVVLYLVVLWPLVAVVNRRYSRK